MQPSRRSLLRGFMALPVAPAVLPALPFTGYVLHNVVTDGRAACGESTLGIPGDVAGVWFNGGEYSGDTLFFRGGKQVTKFWATTYRVCAGCHA